MQLKLRAPRRRDVGKVFVDEHFRGTTCLVGRQRVQTDPGRDVRHQVRGVPHGVAEDDRVEIDEDHLVARQENVVGLQVPMDRGRRYVGEAGLDRRRERLDLRTQLRTGPLHETRRPVHVSELVGEAMVLGERHVRLIEGRHGPGNRAQRRAPVAAVQQHLLQRRALRLL